MARIGMKGRWDYVADPICTHPDCKVLDLPAQVSYSREGKTKRTCVHHIGMIKPKNEGIANLLRELNLV